MKKSPVWLFCTYYPTYWDSSYFLQQSNVFDFKRWPETCLGCPRIPMWCERSEFWSEPWDLFFKFLDMLLLPSTWDSKPFLRGLPSGYWSLLCTCVVEVLKVPENLCLIFPLRHPSSSTDWTPSFLVSSDPSWRYYLHSTIAHHDTCYMVTFLLLPLSF